MPRLQTARVRIHTLQQTGDATPETLMLAINHAGWVSIEMIQKICITNRRLQLSNNETTSTPPRRKSLQVLLIWYKAETNECWWLPHVNNHHRQSVTSTNFRGALLPAPKVGGGGQPPSCCPYSDAPGIIDLPTFTLRANQRPDAPFTVSTAQWSSSQSTAIDTTRIHYSQLSAQFRSRNK